ncbi:hypothetical protein LTR94_004875 [Friedmanniomyces endolithicus]|nr:hypothetical protein LTR94_004875 [Friedmanniomyces endolithicus]
MAATPDDEYEIPLRDQRFFGAGIKRKRIQGLAVLEGHGWSPDSRLGLGPEGVGRLHPVKAVKNPERAGLGARLEEMKAVKKPVRLDAGKVKLLQLEGKRKAEKLRNAFYRSEEVEKYLGEELGSQGPIDEATGPSRRGD